MFANTNALVGALIAVLSESNRLEALIANGSLTDEQEERMTDRVEQMHAAYSELAEEYERRLSEHPGLLPVEALKARIAAEAR